MSEPQKILLLLCTGNTCRSPLADALLKDAIKTRPSLSHIQVQSAGVFAQPNGKASENAREAIKDYNLSLGSHRSQPLTQELINRSFIILGMTASHIDQLSYQFDSLPEKLFRFREWTEDTQKDIIDPFGCNLGVYKECAQTIKEAIPSIISYLESQI